MCVFVSFGDIFAGEDKGVIEIKDQSFLVLLKKTKSASINFDNITS